MNTNKKLIITLFSTVLLFSDKHTYPMSPESSDVHESAAEEYAKGVAASDGNPYVVTPGKSIYLHKLARDEGSVTTMAQSFGIISAENAEPFTPFDSHASNLTIHEEDNSDHSPEEEKLERDFVLARYTTHGCLEDYPLAVGKSGIRAWPHGENVQEITDSLEKKYPTVTPIDLIPGISLEEQCIPATLLFGGARDGNEEIIRDALKAKADVNVKDCNKNTALHIAAQHGCANIVQLLISKNARIDTKNCQRETPLHKAVENQQLTTTALLLYSGAIPDLKTNIGLTARDIAQDIVSRYESGILTHIDKILAEISKPDFDREAAIEVMFGRQ